MLIYHTFDNFESFIFNIKNFSLIIAEEMKKDRDSIHKKIYNSELFKNNADKLNNIKNLGITFIYINISFNV